LNYSGDSGFFTDKRSFQKEKEADLYAGVFLAPKELLLKEPLVQGMLTSLQRRVPMDTGSLWKMIYSVAPRLRVSPSLLKRCFVDFGWLVEGKRRKSRLTTLSLRFLAK